MCILWLCISSVKARRSSWWSAIIQVEVACQAEMVKLEGFHQYIFVEVGAAAAVGDAVTN